MRRLNPARPSDNPMYEMLFCFGSGDNNGGGSAGDFDDSYNQSMGYTDTLGGSGRSDDSGNARQSTAEERAAAPGYDSVIESRAIAAAGGPDYTDVFAGDTAAFNDMQRALSGAPVPGAAALSPSSAAETAARFDTTTPVQGAPRDMGQVSRTEALARSAGIPGAVSRAEQVGSPGARFDSAPAPEDEAVDIFDTAYTGGASPAAEVIAEARDVVRNNIDLETGLPVSVRQANAPTFGDVPNYDETDYLDLGEGLGLVEARQKAVSDLKDRAGEKELFDTGLGYGIVDAILNTTLRPDQMSQQMLDQQGRAVYSVAPEQNVLAVVDPESGNIQPTSGNFLNPELTPVFDQYNRDLGGGGDDGQPAVAAAAPAVRDPCPDGYKFNEQTQSCEYTGVANQGATSYTGAPITQTTQYTGIGALEPFVLRPTYTAPTSFAPSYNVNV